MVAQQILSVEKATVCPKGVSPSAVHQPQPSCCAEGCGWWATHTFALLLPDRVPSWERKAIPCSGGGSMHREVCFPCTPPGGQRRGRRLLQGALWGPRLLSGPRGSFATWGKNGGRKGPCAVQGMLCLVGYHLPLHPRRCQLPPTLLSQPRRCCSMTPPERLPQDSQLTAARSGSAGEQGGELPVPSCLRGWNFPCSLILPLY